MQQTFISPLLSCKICWQALGVDFLVLSRGVDWKEVNGGEGGLERSD
jgi:hypothetical protein